jgi:alkanesulfonate monooxygenase SsuD/methylene tetrahydromethanopterin reductase-like flavin-dependent oxidoreductase (luciferase family)
MSEKPTLGVVLPSQRLPHEVSRDLSQDLRSTARSAADAGAETLWVWDHMLRAPVYQDSWHDPLIALAAVSDFGLRLGTGVLVAPVRPPVQTAMAVATLQKLSGHPMRFGVGTGWNPVEFDAAGSKLTQRGRLTDEFIAVVESVFAGERDFQGRFWQYSGLDTGDIGVAPEIWIAGGSRAAGGGDLGAKEKLITATMADAVAARILKQGRWVLRPSAEFSDYQQDVGALEAAVDGPEVLRDLRTSHILVGHIVETDDPAVAREQQFRAFRQNLVTDLRPPEYLDRRYLLGSLSEIRERLTSWIDIGLEHVGLYLLGDVPTQIALADKHFGDLWTTA